MLCVMALVNQRPETATTLQNFLPLALAPTALARVHELRRWPGTAVQLQAREQEYQATLQPQTFADVAAVYDPAHAARVETTFAAFTPEGATPGRDLGFGLHVVRRLTLPLPDGGERTIEVNEQWPEDRASGGLFLPDEVRVKMQYRDGPRRVPGSEDLFLYDSFRVAWGAEGTLPVLARRSRYRDEPTRGKSRAAQMRSPVSAPFLCITCHRAGERFARPFLEEGETRNGESIVQDSTFRKKLEVMPGWVKYEAYLRGRGIDDAGIARARAGVDRLRDPQVLASLRTVLLREPQVVTWLGEDVAIAEVPGTLLRQGTYARRGLIYLDALETLVPGKYSDWFPHTAVRP